MIGNRQPRFEFTLLNHLDEPLKTLDGVEGGSLEIVALSQLGVSGSLTVVDRGQDIDFQKDRLRIDYDPGIPGVDGWPVGTMMLASNSKQYSDTTQTFQVELLSKMQVLSEATVDYGYSIPAGANIVNKIVELIQSTGETRIAVTESDKTLQSSLDFFENESILEVITKLTTAADYWQVWTDGSGQYRVEPYEDPASRAISYEFVEGDTAIHSAEWVHDNSHTNVPNVVKVRRAGTDDLPGIQGVAVNDDPGSPYSVTARGREITKTYEEEVVDVPTAESVARRYLLANMSPVSHIKVAHAMLHLEPNQRVAFRSQGVETTATIRRMSFSFDDDTLCDAEWAEVS